MHLEKNYTRIGDLFYNIKKEKKGGLRMYINNIFCVGRNYIEHAEELGNTVPKEPMIFSKPTNSIAFAKGQKLFYPKNEGNIHYEIEVVLKIGDDLRGSLCNVEEVVDQMALGIDLTKRDLQSILKKKGYPWLLAKGFKNATILTEFWDFPGKETCKKTDFYLMKNRIVVQKGNISGLIFSFETLINYIHQHFGLKKGDIIFTGTPKGVGPVAEGDTFELWWGKEVKGAFTIGFT